VPLRRAPRSSEDHETLFELAREHTDRADPEKEIKGEQVRKRIYPKAHESE
jgi:hypothetical protein